MRVNTIKKDIIAMLQAKGSGLSFADLSKIEWFNGDNEMAIGSTNIVIWADMSKEAITALDQLRKDEIINIVETSVLTYHADGRILGYPIAKQKKTYKTHRWLPMAINTGHNFPRHIGE